ncbi:MAG: hypothetical protein QXF90_08315 [Thermofilaceae archaeon]
MKPIHKAEYAVTAYSAYGTVQGPGVYAKGLNATTPLSTSYGEAVPTSPTYSFTVN